MPGVIHVLNGPNLNTLGEREPEIYGHDTLAAVEALCHAEAGAAGYDLTFRQTNAEHEMVDWIQAARHGSAGIVITPPPSATPPTPSSTRLKLCDCPIVEVHISNIHRRDEAWRSKSNLTGVVTGIISGLGVGGYALAVRYVVAARDREEQSSRRPPSIELP